MNKSTAVQAIWIVLALGLPASTTAFAFTVSQDPQTALLVCILTLLVEAVFGFLAKVWQQLEPRWVDRTASTLDAAILTLISGYRHRYLEYIVYQHRAFDVKGLATQGVYTLDLDRVFVDLSIDTTPIHTVTADPLQAPSERPSSTNRPIWQYVTSPHFAAQNFAIVGPPGSGKTTLLKHIALVLARSPYHRRRMGAPDKLPVLLFLRDHAATILAQPDLALAQMIRDQLAKWEAPQPPAGWLEDQLKRGRCLVMLDGLDEVADQAARQLVVKWVEKCIVAHGRNRFIVSSRPHGYRSNPISGVTILQVLPFTQKQIESFVHNWYLANEIMSHQRDDPGVQASASQGAADLLNRLRETPTLSALAVNPLLLTMIANIHRYRSSLPGRRVELYAEIFEVFLGKRQQARGLTLDLTPAQKQRILQPLAYSMMLNKQRDIAEAEALKIIAKPIRAVNPDIPGADFLGSVENTSGLLLERENGIYGFAHLTFQEYLTAVHIREHHLEQELTSRVNTSWWHETIRLYCAQADASPIISACLKDNPPTIPALLLAMACEEEAREVQPDVRAKFEAVITRGAEDPDPERRRLIANALLAKRLRHQ